MQKHPDRNVLSVLWSGCSQVVKAERCDRSIHGFDPHQSPHSTFEQPLDYVPRGYGDV